MGRHFSSFISYAFGKFAAKKFSKPVQNFINISYVKLLGLNMSNFKSPKEYNSLVALFTRALEKEPLIDARINSVISPCDAIVVAAGQINQNRAYQIKGMEYNINELIGLKGNDYKVLEEGEFINFYLSPKDYHRYHFPFDVKVLSLLHIPGKLFPVNIPLLKKKKNLYLENERVVLEILDRFGHKHFIVLIGALNVGKIVVTFEPALKTNINAKRPVLFKYETPKEFKKGELFGWFEMGSTIVVLSQKNAIKWYINENQKVNFGKVIGELNDN